MNFFRLLIVFIFSVLFFLHSGCASLNSNPPSPEVIEKPAETQMDSEDVPASAVDDQPIIGKSEELTSEEEKAETPIINLIWAFMFFSILIVLIAVIKEVQDAKMKKQEILEVDPSDPVIWGKSNDFTFKWYNAPYGMAIRA